MAKRDTTHEDFRREHAIKTSSNRSFGVVFAAVFAFLGLWPLFGGGDARIWALALAAIFLAAAFVTPKALTPLNKLWTKFGLLLHHVVNPVVMGFLFYLTVTPTSLVMRLLGKDPLKLRFEPDAKSYWITREPPGPEPETMKNQF